MTRRASPPWLRRCWPQKVRTRLTLIYAALFLAGGSALLGLTYGLLASSLPAQNGAGQKLDMPRAEYLKLCPQPQPAPSKSSLRSSPLPAPSATAKIKQPTPRPRPTSTGKISKKAAKAAEACKNAFVAGSNSQRDRALHDLLLFSLAGLGVMTVASGGAGWVVAGRVLRPVRAITETARRASEQHLGERIALTGARDELKELADTFDDMLARLDQAFAAQRRFIGDASHELRTPLTVMRTAIDVTLAKPARTAEQLEAMAVRVRGAIDRAERTIDALLTLAVSDPGRPSDSEPFDLATAAEDAVDAAAAGIGLLRLRVDSALDPAETRGNPHLLDRMIGNLVDNAVRHNEPGGWIRLRTGVSDGTRFSRSPTAARMFPTMPCQRSSNRSGGWKDEPAPPMASASDCRLRGRSAPRTVRP